MITRNSVPWWVRIGAKMVLSRLPVGYWFWKRLRLFEHGDMNQPARALETYLCHAQTAGFTLPLGEGFCVLELGPGDSIFSALIAKVQGASRAWLVDAGPFATTDPIAYARMAAYFQSKQYSLPFVSNFTDFQNVLTACNAVYLIDGVTSLMQIPDRSVDFCFSNAVLEHIPKKDFLKLVNELMRVLKPDGVCVHRVDLKDHLGGSLNNLRFSEAKWEGPLFSRSGFYTNRIRYSEMLGIFELAGFKCDVPYKVSWNTLPIARTSLASEFKNLPDDDLLISGFDVVLRHKAIC